MTRLARLLPILVAPAICLALYLPVLAGGKHFYFRDVLTFTYPEKLWTAESFAHGRLPLWDPRLAGGVPHLAYVTHGVFDPMNLVLLLAALPRALDLILVGHVVIAALLAFGLARSLGLTPAGAALAALGYALGGGFQGLTDNLPFLASAAYLPGALWMLERLVAAPGPRPAALLALAVALTFVAGDPQLVYVLLLLLPLRLALGGRERAGRRIAAGALAVLLALGLIAVVLLPGAELLARSERAAGVPLAEAELMSLHPLRLVELLVPLPWGSPVPDIHWWGSFLENFPTGEPWVLTLYPGLAVLLLAPIGGVAAARRACTGSAGPCWLAVVGALGLLLALGRHAPAYAAIHHVLPGFDRFRYPAKLWLWPALVLPLLAGLGLDRLAAGAVPAVRRAGAVALGLALTAGLAVALADATRVRALGDLVGARFERVSPALAASDLRHRLGHTAAAALALGLGWITLSGGSSWARSRLVVVVAAADLGLVAGALQAFTGDPLYRRVPAVAAAIVASGIDRRDQRVAFVPEFSRFAELPPQDPLAATLTPLERLRLEDVDNLSPNLALAQGLRNDGGYLSAQPLQTQRWWERVWASRDPQLVTRVLRLTATAVVVASADSGAGTGLAQLPGLRLLPAPRGLAPGAALLAVREPLPRAYVAARAVPAGTPEAALRLIADPAFVPGRDCTIEGEEPAAGSRAVGGEEAASASGGSARIVTDEGNRVVVEGEAGAAGGWLVLADSFDPGWRATVDGRPEALRRANGLQRAARLGPGSHRVVFEYAPASYLRGRAISAAALGACLLLLGAGALRRGRGSERPAGGGHAGSG